MQVSVNPGGVSITNILDDLVGSFPIVALLVPERG